MDGNGRFASSGFVPLQNKLQKKTTLIITQTYAPFGGVDGNAVGLLQVLGDEVPVDVEPQRVAHADPVIQCVGPVQGPGQPVHRDTVHLKHRASKSGSQIHQTGGHKGKVLLCRRGLRGWRGISNHGGNKSEWGNISGRGATSQKAGRTLVG